MLPHRLSILRINSTKIRLLKYLIILQFFILYISSDKLIKTFIYYNGNITRIENSNYAAIVKHYALFVKIIRFRPRLNPIRRQRDFPKRRQPELRP